MLLMPAYYELMRAEFAATFASFIVFAIAAIDITLFRYCHMAMLIIITIRHGRHALPYATLLTLMIIAAR